MMPLPIIDDRPVVPYWDCDGVPECTASCPQYREAHVRSRRGGPCEIQPLQSGSICEPAVAIMSRRLSAACVRLAAAVAYVREAELDRTVGSAGHDWDCAVAHRSSACPQCERARVVRADVGVP